MLSFYRKLAFEIGLFILIEEHEVAWYHICTPVTHEFFMQVLKFQSSIPFGRMSVHKKSL